VSIVPDRIAKKVRAGNGAVAAAKAGEKRAPLGQQVAAALRRAILTGRYKPGERLVEDRLSAEFKVSRVPVREALKTLAAEGLVVPMPRRGARVAELSREFGLELVEVRATLEGLNARLAARRHDPAVIARLRDVLDRGTRAARAGAMNDLVQLNAEYHDLLAVAGNNRVLQDIMRPLRERTDLVFRRNTPERAAEDWREHASILSAIVGGDEELAVLLATRHVHRAARDRLGSLLPPLGSAEAAEAPNAALLGSRNPGPHAPAASAAPKRGRGERPRYQMRKPDPRQ
jgi:DNA-binding GntR family transcriptional regulator